MISKSSLVHLRLPFSIFLAPVFFFALSQSQTWNGPTAVILFFILHLLVYPASNAFNSYYDRDKGSIGGIESPPPVQSDLLIWALVMDAVALVLSLFLGWTAFLLLLAYGIASKLYSHPAVRLKSRPFAGLAVVTIFQGAIIYLLVATSLSPTQPWVSHLFPALLSTLLLAGAYPMTQIYQHDEDCERGDLTLSLRLGVRGTFIFSACVFTFSMAGFLLFFAKSLNLASFIWMQAFLFIPMGYFLLWFLKTWKNPTHANFRNTMRMNSLFAIGANGFFIFLCV